MFEIRFLDGKIKFVHDKILSIFIKANKENVVSYTKLTKEEKDYTLKLFMNS